STARSLRRGWQPPRGRAPALPGTRSAGCRFSKAGRQSARFAPAAAAQPAFAPGDEDPAIDEIAQLAADQRIEEKLAADPARWAGEEKLEIGIALEQPGQHANQAIAALEIT